MDYKLLLSRLLKFSDPVSVRRRDVFFCVMFIPLYTKIPLSCCYSRRISAFPAMKMDKMKIFVAKKPAHHGEMYGFLCSFTSAR